MLVSNKKAKLAKVGNSSNLWPLAHRQASPLIRRVIAVRYLRKTWIASTSGALVALFVFRVHLGVLLPLKSIRNIDTNSKVDFIINSNFFIGSLS